MKKKEIVLTFILTVWCIGCNAEVFEDELNGMGITYEEIENLYGDKTYRLYDVNKEQEAYIRNLEEEGISVIDD